MSMLAEPRSRQKWSHDPQNTAWARDKNKFGYQMLTKMGWNEGGGLGRTLSGTTSHIKVNKRRSSAGVGMKKSHDDDWIGHQDDFNALLSSLNQNSKGTSTGKITSLEDNVKSSRKKILYKKFIKSKDLSNASSDDLACIFGQRGTQSAPATPQESSDEEEKCKTEDTSEVNIVETGVSVADYFARRMAEIQEKKKQASLDTKENIVRSVKIESTEVENDVQLEKCSNILIKKENDISEDIVIDNAIEKKKKKKKRKVVDLETESTEDVSVIKKKKKKDRVEIDNVTEEDNSTEQLENIKKKKKKKKKHEIDDDN